MPKSPPARPRDLPFDPTDKIVPKTFHQLPKMGLEFEMFAFDSKSYDPLGCAGARWTPRGILEALVAVGPPGTRLVVDALTGVATGVACPSGCGFSLEPGGQVEFATQAHTHFEALLEEIVWALESLEKATLGEVAFLSHGTHPTALDTFPLLVPKERYAILNQYLSSVPQGRGTHMMRRTATVQPNVDTIGGLEGWRQSVRAVGRLSPVLSQLWANSNWFNGAPSQFPSERQEIWNHTDPSRTGYDFLRAPIFSNTECVEEAYVEWAWNAFVVLVMPLPLDQQPRFGELTFGQWWQGGYKGVFPDKSHWEQHLTTLFPHLRLRRFLEIRDVDGQDFSQLAHPLAVWVALLQTQQGLELCGEWEKDNLSPTGQAVIEGAHRVASQTWKGGAVEKVVAQSLKALQHPETQLKGTALEFVQRNSSATPSVAFRRGHAMA